ncbi:unnamed protein product [Orchesella dallaii]|uniref:Uncharacterized protein n=1 Tax=Orchesella dallaii TaxID=48710 RepID=A0ABP1Q1N3_9HEXA
MLQCYPLFILITLLILGNHNPHLMTIEGLTCWQCTTGPNGKGATSIACDENHGGYSIECEWGGVCIVEEQQRYSMTKVTSVSKYCSPVVGPGIEMGCQRFDDPITPPQYVYFACSCNATDDCNKYGVKGVGLMPSWAEDSNRRKDAAIEETFTLKCWECQEHYDSIEMHQCDANHTGISKECGDVATCQVDELREDGDPPKILAVSKHCYTQDGGHIGIGANRCSSLTEAPGITRHFCSCATDNCKFIF